MATTTYSVDYDGAKLLYRWAGEDRSWVRRLEDMKGTEEDARQAIRIFDQLGRTTRADALRSLLGEEPPPSERRASLFAQRLELHANDVAEALPDDPGEAIIVLMPFLAVAARAALGVSAGPVSDSCRPALEEVADKLCETLREAIFSEER